MINLEKTNRFIDLRGDLETKLFYIGILFLASAPFFSCLLFLYPLFKGLLNSKKNILKDKINRHLFFLSELFHEGGLLGIGVILKVSLVVGDLCERILIVRLLIKVFLESLQKHRATLKRVFAKALPDLGFFSGSSYAIIDTGDIVV